MNEKEHFKFKSKDKLKNVKEKKLMLSVLDKAKVLSLRSTFNNRMCIQNKNITHIYLNYILIIKYINTAGYIKQKVYRDKYELLTLFSEL